jgi:hypothetical protein
MAADVAEMAVVAVVAQARENAAAQELAEKFAVVDVAPEEEPDTLAATAENGSAAEEKNVDESSNVVAPRADNRVEEKLAAAAAVAAETAGYHKKQAGRTLEAEVGRMLEVAEGAHSCNNLENTRTDAPLDTFFETTINKKRKKKKKKKKIFFSIHKLDLSERAATPGKTRPSRSSRLAPPPVDTWLSK